MRNTWLAEQLQALKTEQNQLVIEETLRYIEQLEDDNESLQVALEGNIWSPKKWNENR
ncbi:hypothetical protein [Enterococcus pallens]|uniref:Uncharacterized protein n=1 Tax=Enterococcus pallens ATCC BAA-351 TaxID=1158607 RepID=R2Q9T1_9ENTE|nr:hypothetical protein [Enterococcus pallens]EOH93202.1 hypothetical protein UAU_02845 [Enterococcus pallens ATCC BAA-351]EOU24988.1 hypothetical protein I588_00976 [Enterococcus pallens ATCC BAA-351]OJG76722.1 hypothetical protein RV10_GL003322 [Enterococcus pallens]